MQDNAYFELDEEVLFLNYRNLEKTLNKYWPNFKVGYSYKTNSLPWLINWMKSKGAFAEVVSTPEYKLAKKIGYSPSEIIMNGPNKGNSSMKEVLDSGGVVNLDGFHEINWIEENIKDRKHPWEVGLRINIDLEKVCPGETIMGKDPGRFGFSVENGDFLCAIKRLNYLKGIKVVGIHVHHSTKTKSLNVFKNLAEKSASLGSKYLEKFKFLDIGGGFYGDKANSPDYDKYFNVISNEIMKYTNPENTLLIVEPGIALAASCFSYICKVLNVKEINLKKLIMTNGSCMHIDPQMKSRNFDYLISTEKERNKIQEQIVCGFTCIENDRFLLLKNEVELNIGDTIKIQNAGAYTLSFAPLFIEYFPKVILARDQIVIREEWGINEYTQLCKF